MHAVGELQGLLEESRCFCMITTIGPGNVSYELLHHCRRRYPATVSRRVRLRSAQRVTTSFLMFWWLSAGVIAGPQLTVISNSLLASNLSSEDLCANLRQRHAC